MRRFEHLTVGEISDLGNAAVRGLAIELRRLRIAGPESVERWQLAESLRLTLDREHGHARERSRRGSTT